MPSKCSVFVGVSLDGFIARIDGAIDWLDKANGMAPSGEDFGFSQFMSSVDAIVMGRNTFGVVVSFEPWPYGSTPVVVLSNRLTTLPPNTPPTVSLSSLAPRALVEELGAKGMSHLYVDGGLTIQSFFAADIESRARPPCGRQNYSHSQRGATYAHQQNPFACIEFRYGGCLHSEGTGYCCR